MTSRTAADNRPLALTIDSLDRPTLADQQVGHTIGALLERGERADDVRLALNKVVSGVTDAERYKAISRWTRGLLAIEEGLDVLVAKRSAALMVSMGGAGDVTPEAIVAMVVNLFISGRDAVRTNNRAGALLNWAVQQAATQAMHHIYGERDEEEQWTDGWAAQIAEAAFDKLKSRWA